MSKFDECNHGLEVKGYVVSAGAYTLHELSVVLVESIHANDIDELRYSIGKLKEAIVEFEQDVEQVERMANKIMGVK